MKTLTGWLMLAVCVGLGVPVGAGSSEDDLAVVKKAVAKGEEKQVAKVEDSSKGKPQWIHVRIEGKGTKKEKVSVNLPFALVEALGDVPIHCKKFEDASGKAIHLADILKALKAGQELVEIDDQESTVRVWLD